MSLNVQNKMVQVSDGIEVSDSGIIWVSATTKKNRKSLIIYKNLIRQLSFD